MTYLEDITLCTRSTKKLASTKYENELFLNFFSIKFDKLLFQVQLLTA